MDKTILLETTRPLTITAFTYASLEPVNSHVMEDQEWSHMMNFAEAVKAELLVQGCPHNSPYFRPDFASFCNRNLPGGFPSPLFWMYHRTHSKSWRIDHGDYLPAHVLTHGDSYVTVEWRDAVWALLVCGVVRLEKIDSQPTIFHHWNGTRVLRYDLLAQLQR